MIYHARTKKNKEKGFTLIEVMIAMGIFTILVTIGIGAVLDAIQQHHASENVRTVMDNLNFVMEDMARNIRLGQNIQCVASGETFPVFVTPTDPVVPEDCAPGGTTVAHSTIIFNDENGNHVMYQIAPTVADPTIANIYKLKGDVYGNRQLISPPEVAINFAQSGFIVRGSLSTDNTQPTVLIKLTGTVTYKGIPSAFSIETTVEPRGLDS